MIFTYNNWPCLFKISTYICLPFMPGLSWPHIFSQYLFMDWGPRSRPLEQLKFKYRGPTLCVIMRTIYNIM